jgi:formate hydrogenlyase transcriptional activator
MDRRIEKIPADTMRALITWPWRGNVRELENFIERSVILSGGPILRVPLGEIQQDAPESTSSATLEDMERAHIIRVLRESRGVVTIAARTLGLVRTTLHARMRKLGISRDFAADPQGGSTEII